MVYFAIVLGAILLYSITVYNSLVNIQANVKKAWSNIGVLLKQRHDELPKLIDTCKIYMKHEQETLEKVIQARSAVQTAQNNVDANALSSAEAVMKASLGNLFALAESYPDLKADTHFKDLQARISGLESQIADRREFYNDSVNINNVRIKQFPDVIVASMFNFKSARLLKFTATETKDINISDRFNA